ncbi:MAG TPA: hypothetical protein GX524_02665 [Firmicutes bacterium]|jgi:cell division protein FtsL|nr:hypothetical protein [Bacillota bacterium]
MRQKKIRGIRLSALWFVIGLMAITFVVRQIEVIRIQRHVAEIEAEIDHFRMSNSALQEQVETLKSRDHIEKIAREKLGLVMPGEVQYIPVVNDDKGE